jgi:hypothetical protein
MLQIPTAGYLTAATTIRCLLPPISRAGGTDYCEKCETKSNEKNKTEINECTHSVSVNNSSVMNNNNLRVIQSDAVYHNDGDINVGGSGGLIKPLCYRRLSSGGTV